MSFLAAHLDNTAGFNATLTQLEPRSLKEGEVRIAVDYSSLNYKDALAITNHAPVVRTWPMVAGIDGVGTVIESLHPAWQKGDQVISQGFGTGETIWGCLAQQVCLSGDKNNIFTRTYHALRSDGAGHCWIYCDAVCSCIRAAWDYAGLGLHFSNWCFWRCWLARGHTTC